MRPTGEDSPKHRGQPRGGDLLPMPEVPGTTVRVQTMDPMPAIERCDQLEVPPATGRKAQVLCRGAGGDGSGNLPTLINASEGIQCLPDQGDLPLLQQGDSAGKEGCCHRDGFSQQPLRDTTSSFTTPTPTSPQAGMTEPEDYQDFMDFLRWRRMKGPSSQ